MEPPNHRGAGHTDHTVSRAPDRRRVADADDHVSAHGLRYFRGKPLDEPELADLRYFHTANYT